MMLGHTVKRYFKDGASQYRGIFAKVMSMRKKEISVRPIGIQKEEEG